VHLGTVTRCGRQHICSAPHDTRLERRLFEATKLYAGKEDKAQTYPYWKVWIDPSLGSEVATLQTNIENYVQ
jgi:hypothetical protein